MNIQFTNNQNSYLVIKCLCDFIIALLAFIGSLPLLLALMLWIGLDSRGGIFYLQKRPGKNNRLFPLIKFRSMVRRPREAGFALTQENDARLTTAGKWLRKYIWTNCPSLSTSCWAT